MFISNFITLTMRQTDIEVIPGAPFAHCKLGRERYANVLTSIMEAYKDGFVLAVNGKWGTGKTTFMKMWEQSLKDKGYKTIFFNAWENDFVSEPMVAILGELNGVFHSAIDQGFMEKAIKVSSSVFPSLLKAAAPFVGLSPVADVVEKLSEASFQAVKDEIKKYKQNKESLDDLKKELAAFVKKECEMKPLIFIVDELDRCRPDYAVEVLEKIKHLFSVEGIVFVLSVDKEQLGNAIKGYYGSEGIDSPEYLRRFIDLEYVLPDPDYKDFCTYAYSKYQLDKFFKSNDRVRNDFGDETGNLLKMASVLASAQKMSLRQIEKLFTLTRISTRMFKPNQYVFPDFLFLIIYIKCYHSDRYANIIGNRISIQELVGFLETIFGQNIQKETNSKYVQRFHDTLAYLLVFYVIQYNEKEKIRLELFQKDSENKELAFEVKLLSKDKLLSAIVRFQDTFYGYDIPLNLFTEKIDLLEDLKS